MNLIYFSVAEEIKFWSANKLVSDAWITMLRFWNNLSAGVAWLADDHLRFLDFFDILCRNSDGLLAFIRFKPIVETSTSLLQSVSHLVECDSALANLIFVRTTFVKVNALSAVQGLKTN
jgi:hypothetical protein